jgi:3D (Asp-Asp-Asp) domain-containing protein
VCLALLSAVASSIVPSLPAVNEALAAPVTVTAGLAGQIQAQAIVSPQTEGRATGVYSLRNPQNLGHFRITFYWLVEEDDYQGKKTNPLYAPDGRLVGRFTSKFIHDFRIESCALLSDGRVISYLKKANRCQVVDAPIGANGYSLTELRSVAVDPSVIPPGSRLYIKDAADVRLGDSLIHDGIFYAHDVGSAIKGNRIDVYLGPKSNMDLFRSTALCHSGDVEVYLLQ